MNFRNLGTPLEWLLDTLQLVAIFVIVGTVCLLAVALGVSPA